MRSWHSLRSETRTIILSKFSLHNYHIESQIAHERAICHNPHNLSDWDYCITRQVGLQIHLSKCIHKKLASSYIFVKT